MKYLILAISAFVFVAIAHAQSYSPGLPMPGLPKSLGSKTMANSTSVTLASDQGAISVTGATANNSSVGTNGAVAPTDSTQIGGVDQSGRLTPLKITNQGITVSVTGVATEATLSTISANLLSGVQKTQISDALGVTVTVRALGSQVQSADVGLVSNAVIHGLSSGGGGSYVDVKVNPSGSLEVNANQGTSPWIVQGGVAITNTASVFVPGGVAITNTPTVNQGTSPWVVSSTAVTVTASTITRVANSASSQSLLVANGSRKQVFLYNDAATTACYVKFGATASTTDFTLKLFATDTYSMDPPVYTGAIDYICDAASGSMEVSEQ